MWTGDQRLAGPRAEEAVRCAKRSGDDFALAAALEARVVGILDYERIAPRAHETVPCLRALGDLVGTAFACSVSGYSAIVAGRYSEALQWLHEGLAAARNSDQLASICHNANNLGLARLFNGDADGAAQALAEALPLSRPAGLELIASETLLAMATVQARRGDGLGAVRLAAAAEASLTPPVVDDEAKVMARLRTQFIDPCEQALDRTTWQRATHDGATMPLSEAIELALTKANPTRVATRSTTPLTAA
jgi:tetratricopeptide (TPR) repeat protein